MGRAWPWGVRPPRPRLPRWLGAVSEAAAARPVKRASRLVGAERQQSRDFISKTPTSSERRGERPRAHTRTSNHATSATREGKESSVSLGCSHWCALPGCELTLAAIRQISGLPTAFIRLSSVFDRLLVHSRLSSSPPHQHHVPLRQQDLPSSRRARFLRRRAHSGSDAESRADRPSRTEGTSDVRPGACGGSGLRQVHRRRQQHPARRGANRAAESSRREERRSGSKHRRCSEVQSVRWLTGAASSEWSRRGRNRPGCQAGSSSVTNRVVLLGANSHLDDAPADRRILLSFSFCSEMLCTCADKEIKQQRYWGTEWAGRTGQLTIGTGFHISPAAAMIRRCSLACSSLLCDSAAPDGTQVPKFAVCEGPIGAPVMQPVMQQ